ncbi:MAG: MmgE/PrpD family protein [Pseudomonadota bacterium]
MTVIERFAAFAAEIDPQPEAVAAGKLCLLDWMGAAIAGSQEAPATMLRRAFPGDGPARLVPDGEGRDPRTAALINATASHIVEVDDIYRSGLYHPGVVTIPAALALCEAEGRSGTDLLRAIIAGYEVSNRIARAVNPAHYEYWHTTATVGHFGAAAAACSALGLDAGKTAHALATATTFAAGLRHAFSSDAMSKPLHAGRAAEGGVAAALMAREGVTGVADMLEGPRGFGMALARDVDWDGPMADLGTHWTICETTPKAYACCGHNFAALDAIGELMQEHDLDSSGIAEIRIASYRAALEICGNPDPRSAAEGRFSLPWCAAVMASQGSVTPDAFTPDALADPVLHALAARVVLELDEEAEARFPNARSATVTITLTDGREFERYRPTRKGDPDDPMSADDLRKKFLALTRPVLGETPSEALADHLFTIERIANLHKIPVGQA